jgi:chromosome segregation ATPase
MDPENDSDNNIDIENDNNLAFDDNFEDVNQDNNNPSIHSFNEDADFPAYANRINKRLNQIIKNYKDEIKLINNEIEEDKGMTKVLDEHAKSVRMQVKNKEMLVEQTKQNLDSEAHSLQLIKLHIGKLSTQIEELNKQETGIQERLNHVQHSIHNANQKMDTYKIKMNDKLEELHQWATAANQKKYDFDEIENYKRHDDQKIKDLMLFIEKLSLEVNRKSHELEKEVTETQAAQIEMEKTTEELKRLQIERQDLLEKFLKTQEQIKARHEELKEECEKYFNNKTVLSNLKSELDSKVESLAEKQKMNKQALDDLKRQETELGKFRDQLNVGENALKELINEIEIKKRNLSVLAKMLSTTQDKINSQKNELDFRRKKLDTAKE